MILKKAVFNSLSKIAKFIIAAEEKDKMKNASPRPILKQIAEKVDEILNFVK